MYIKSLFIVSFALCLLNCVSKNVQKNYFVEYNLENINEGRIIVSYKNVSKKPLKYPQEIPNDAFIITNLEEIQGTKYIKIPVPKIHFDCFKNPCFPLTKYINPQEKKLYFFTKHSFKELKEGKYRVKFYLENYLEEGSSSYYTQPDWLYFDIVK